MPGGGSGSNSWTREEGAVMEPVEQSTMRRGGGRLKRGGQGRGMRK